MMMVSYSKGTLSAGAKNTRGCENFVIFDGNCQSRKRYDTAHGCVGKTVKSLENTCHTWALLRWWFTTKCIECMDLYLYLNCHCPAWTTVTVSTSWCRSSLKSPVVASYQSNSSTNFIQICWQRSDRWCKWKWWWTGVTTKQIILLVYRCMSIVDAVLHWTDGHSRLVDALIHCVLCVWRHRNVCSSSATY